MAIEVRVPTILRTHTQGEKKVSAEGATVGEVIDDLDRRHPEIKDKLVAEDGSLQRFVNLYVNDEDVRYLGGIDTALEDGDVVAILPAVAGGARR